MGKIAALDEALGGGPSTPVGLQRSAALNRAGLSASSKHSFTSPPPTGVSHLSLTSVPRPLIPYPLWPSTQPWCSRARGRRGGASRKRWRASSATTKSSSPPSSRGWEGGGRRWVQEDVSDSQSTNVLLAESAQMTGEAEARGSR